MNAAGKALRYARTFRFLRPSQMAWRAWYILRPKLPFVNRRRRVECTGALDSATLERLRGLLRLRERHAPVPSDELAHLRQGRIHLLNRSLDAAAGIPWRLENLSKLAQYTLHYMDFARVLAQANRDQPAPGDAAIILRWCEDWIAANPPGTPVAWDPYPLASRLMNWCLAWSVFGPEVAVEPVRQSLAQQTDALLRHLEYDVRANHLLKNAQALVVAGSVLGADSPVGSKARRVGQSLLLSELREQILPDGGHYERSPMYHCHVLEDTLTAFAAWNERPAELEEFLRRMAVFLAGITHPDGHIPLFGDSVLHGGPSPTALCAMTAEVCGSHHAQPPADGVAAFESSGFFTLPLNDPNTWCIVKAGAPGPRYQLGHAHGDPLSFELSIEGRRVIVDSGVSEYEAGAMRSYCRGVSAHNTVAVNQREPLEWWGAFRVGRRYACRVLEWTPPSKKWGQSPIFAPEADRAKMRNPKIGDCPHFFHFFDGILRASHDGFAPYVHHRAVRACAGRFWIIEDTIQGPGAFDASSFLHFHPDAAITESNGVFFVTLEDAAVTVVPFEADRVTLCRGDDAAKAPDRSWYCPAFGVAIPNAVLVIAHAQGFRAGLVKAGTGRSRFGYAILPYRADAALLSEARNLWDAMAT